MRAIDLHRSDSSRQPSHRKGRVTVPEKHYWFRKKTRGKSSGWVPASREGWIAIAIFFVAELGGIALLIPLTIKTPHFWILPAWCIGCTAAFLALVFAKGEPLW